MLHNGEFLRPSFFRLISGFLFYFFKISLGEMDFSEAKFYNTNNKRHSLLL
jgi:hypothetical protein